MTINRIPSDMIADRESGQKLSDMLSDVASDLAGKANQADLDKSNKKINVLPTTIHNSDGIIDRLLAIAQTYNDNIGSFAYGNSGTAYSPSVLTPNGKFQMDCSSFANLMIHGVPFQNSRYANPSNPKNIENPLFFLGVDGYTYRLANQLAQYAYDNGYSFTPNSDFSNVEPGDVMFYSWTYFDTNPGSIPQSSLDFHNQAFMKIDHVAIMGSKKNDTYWNTIQFNEDLGSVYYPADNAYMSQCVLVARFPFANVETMYSNENLLFDGDTVKNGVSAATYSLTKPLVKGQYYSMFVKADSITSGRRLLLQTATFQTIFDDTGKTTDYGNGIIEIRFPYLLDEVTNVIRVAINGTTPIGNFTWSQLYSGYKRSKQNYVKNPNSKSSWVTPSFQNSWIATTNHPVSYRIDSNNMVSVRGVVQSGASGSIAFQLPAGFRPTQFMTFPSVNTTGAASSRVTVDTSGNVSIQGDTTFVILNGVKFYTD